MKDVSWLRVFICVIVVIVSFLIGWYIVPVQACDFEYPAWYIAYTSYEPLPKATGLRKGEQLTDDEIALITQGTEMTPNEFHQALARAMLYKAAYNG